MSNYQICKDQIDSFLNTYTGDINISKVSKLARPNNKTICLKEFGGFTDLNKYITDHRETHGVPEFPSTPEAVIPEVAIQKQSFRDYLMGNEISKTDTDLGTITQTDNKNIQYNLKQNTTKTTKVYTGSTQNTGSVWYSANHIYDYSQNIFIRLLVFLAVFLCGYILKCITSFLYDVINNTRMIYMKVTLPRGDSKGDREVQREISKDMKEKIGRMSQVFRGLHKLGQLSVGDNILAFLFRKPKVVCIYHYELGTLSFIIGTYPEYQEIVQGAISAQYPESSIETTIRPDFFKYKYSEVVPLEPIKDPIYPIRTFKQIEDDPINNTIDTVSQFSTEDSFDIILTIKPLGQSFNKKAQQWSEGLYRNDANYVHPKKWYNYLLRPFKVFGFLFKSANTATPGAENKYQEGGKDFVRMTKAKEDAINTMGEEAARHAFTSSLLLVSSSDNPENPTNNIRNIVSAYNVYKDEFNNELHMNEWKVGTLGFILKPLWNIAARYHLVKFGFKNNIFTENALTSLFHLPDGIYNRSPIIKWMDYKVISAPDNLPLLQNVNEKYIISGSITEDYLGGKINDIFADSNHRAIGDIPSPLDTKNNDTQSTEPDQNISHISKKGLRIYKDGSLIGVNVYRNQFEPVYIKRKDRSRHHYVIGKSGGGKSVLLGFLARQDAWNGDGFCVIDPHGDLVEEVMEYIPPERAKDVIYFNAGDESRPIGLNLYQINSLDEADRVVNDATEMFLKMFGPEIFGPRLQEYFKFGSLTLLEDMEEGATLLDVPRLFTDEAFRNAKVAKITNPVVRNFWERTYASIGDREKEEIIPYLTAKFVSFTTNSLIRNIIGQTKSAVNFRDIMDSGKILLVNLSKGKIGELNAQLLGMIFVSQINNGAMSRANIPEDQRRDFFLYVDEFQNFVTNTFADILSEARKYHLALIMAHQYIAQLDGGGSNNIGENQGGKKSVKDAVFGNVGTIQSFKVGAPDAEFLEKEYSPVLSAQDIIGISNFKTYTKLNINNATSRVFSLDTIWSQDYKNKKVAEVIKKYSAMKHGRERKFVEAEIGARIGIVAGQDSGNPPKETENTPDINPIPDPDQNNINNIMTSANNINMQDNLTTNAPEDIYSNSSSDGDTSTIGEDSNNITDGGTDNVSTDQTILDNSSGENTITTDDTNNTNETIYTDNNNSNENSGAQDISTKNTSTSTDTEQIEQTSNLEVEQVIPQDIYTENTAVENNNSEIINSETIESESSPDESSISQVIATDDISTNQILETIASVNDTNTVKNTSEDIYTDSNSPIYTTTENISKIPTEELTPQDIYTKNMAFEVSEYKNTNNDNISDDITNNTDKPTQNIYTNTNLVEDTETQKLKNQTSDSNIPLDSTQSENIENNADLSVTNTNTPSIVKNPTNTVSVQNLSTNIDNKKDINPPA